MNRISSILIVFALCFTQLAIAGELIEIHLTEVRSDHPDLDNDRLTALLIFEQLAKRYRIVELDPTILNDIHRPIPTDENPIMYRENDGKVKVTPFSDQVFVVQNKFIQSSGNKYRKDSWLWAGEIEGLECSEVFIEMGDGMIQSIEISPEVEAEDRSWFKFYLINDGFFFVMERKPQSGFGGLSNDMHRVEDYDPCDNRGW